ncbi:MAG: hypothetical protein QOE70_754 [Chthoniobacter sp.]|jgi:hypothetical protein|nr:hypothetical protein [Chthoniobacter sp.]
MIDRPSRNRLAEALRQYVSGVLTNDDLDDVAVDWRDRGAVAVKGRAWGLYDDNYPHRATGRHYLGKPARHEIGRWILFLHSDLEYTWPDFDFMQIVNWPINVLTFGWWERRKGKRFCEFTAAGDFDVWPFASHADHERALEQPRLLANRAAPR